MDGLRARRGRPNSIRDATDFLSRPSRVPAAFRCPSKPRRIGSFVTPRCAIPPRFAPRTALDSPLPASSFRSEPRHHTKLFLARGWWLPLAEIGSSTVKGSFTRERVTPQSLLGDRGRSRSLPVPPFAAPLIRLCGSCTLLRSPHFPPLLISPHLPHLRGHIRYPQHSTRRSLKGFI
ncbi:hypothetical protein GY45DRAFT_1105146 [Cubamyces sp. BRFM 1775]|nr:hypothetical protein GY45DRAFT_1105146 [Cubamyces sp. BRFM 1775]